MNPILPSRRIMWIHLERRTKLRLGSDSEFQRCCSQSGSSATIFQFLSLVLNHHHRGRPARPPLFIFTYPHFMLNKPIETKPDSSENQLSQPNQRYNQHGRFSILLALPVESLTHITCFLDPPSLCTLAKINKHLNAHVENDNTWHRAFVYQFFGIAPEGDYNAKMLLLRRSESSWRKEFVVRYNLRRYSGLLPCIHYPSLILVVGVGSDPITPQLPTPHTTVPLMGFISCQTLAC